MQILTNDKISLFILKTQGVCLCVYRKRDNNRETEIQGQRDRDTDRHTEIFNLKGYQMGQSLFCFIMIY